MLACWSSGRIKPPFKKGGGVSRKFAVGPMHGPLFSKPLLGFSWQRVVIVNKWVSSEGGGMLCALFWVKGGEVGRGGRGGREGVGWLLDVFFRGFFPFVGGGLVFLFLWPGAFWMRREG